MSLKLNLERMKPKPLEPHRVTHLFHLAAKTKAIQRVRHSGPAGDEGGAVQNPPTGQGGSN